MTKPTDVRAFVERIEQRLLPELDIISLNDKDPIEVRHIPSPWRVEGAGNYAVVFTHPDHPELAVKVYADGRPGLADEAEVYRRLGRHPAYSECYGVGDRYLVLKRIHGATLYDCLCRGIPIPERVIRDVDEALAYAAARGLFPRDIHGKNVMNDRGAGRIVDVSDFLDGGSDSIWRDFKRVYYRLYLPIVSRRPFPIPRWVLELCRKGYRAYKSFAASPPRGGRQQP